MRKLLSLLFPALAAFAILGCSNNDDMPCATCDSRGGSTSQGSVFQSVSSCPNSVTGNGTVSCGGETYETVVIGSQTWMARNLNYDPGTGNSGCYNNDPSRCATYGRLYDWSTAMGICPSGWHLPSADEWSELVNYVESYYGCYSCAARYLKARNGWNSGGNGEDTFGFAALPGGYGYSGGLFSDVGYDGSWWSASENNANSAYGRDMHYYYENAYWDYYYKGDLLSVRCLQD